MRIPLLRIALAVGCAVTGNRASAQGGTFLRYLNAPVPGADIAEPPRLHISFGGRAHRADRRDHSRRNRSERGHVQGAPEAHVVLARERRGR